MVSKVPKQNFDNRPSEMQIAILAYLATVGQPEPYTDSYGSGHKIGHLPTTGAIVDAIGYERDKAGYAAVSRSLRRLVERGLVCACSAMICARGKGFRYFLLRGESV